MTDLDLEKYWNEKYPQQNIIYSGRIVRTLCAACKEHTFPTPIQMDVRDIITPNDSQLKEIIMKYNLKADTNDETMWRIQKFVVANLKYVGDDVGFGALEFWQFPFETIKLKVGDCEDGAILMASLAINAGVPSYRVRVTAGMVQPAPTAPQGGHAYVTYLRESSNEWVICDWCFYEDSNIEISKKILMKENTYYKEIWFSFNNLYAWGANSLEVAPRIRQVASIS